MKRTLTVCVATMVAISALWSARAQELTTEQKKADERRQYEAQLAEMARKEASAAFWSSLTDIQREMTLLRLAEVSAKVKNPPLPTSVRPTTTIRPKSMTASIDTTPIILESNGEGGETDDPEGDMELNIFSRGTGGGLETTNYLNLGPYQRYGIAAVESWQTDDPYPWHTKNDTLTGTNGPMGESFLDLPKGSMSWTFAVVTNHFDQYGKPRAHIFNCWMKFNRSTRGTFLCTRGSISSGQFVAYISSASWAQNSLIVPPFSGNTDSLLFILSRNALTDDFIPYGEIHNSPQWYPYVPMKYGLTITPKTNSFMEISWDALAQSTQYYHLEYANNLSGPWASNTTPVSIANYTATVSFAKTNAQRFYRLKPH